MTNNEQSQQISLTQQISTLMTTGMQENNIHHPEDLWDSLRCPMQKHKHIY